MATKLTPTEVKEITGLYKAGLNTVDLAERFEVHRTTIWRTLVKAGIQPDPYRRDYWRKDTSPEPGDHKYHHPEQPPGVVLGNNDNGRSKPWRWIHAQQVKQGKNPKWVPWGPAGKKHRSK
jgi:hypothetical protein